MTEAAQTGPNEANCWRCQFTKEYGHEPISAVGHTCGRDNSWDPEDDLGPLKTALSEAIRQGNPTPNDSDGTLDVEFSSDIDPDLIDAMLQDIGSREELSKILKDAIDAGEAKPVFTWQEDGLVCVKDSESGEVFRGNTLSEALDNMTGGEGRESSATTD